ncbi:hypothetical protein LTR56_014448 [Elasticomyces elasticus]|nr:hypothetical protein LTR56_014448 [Elasticomyces elasticus]KAK3646506.1 hypothetical protein LTR22_014269 [Elasticomyces elasticus]KAK4908577.1 hypothetical protein LTR49_022535 [Elasticomyces elasticus]KAK5755683.1 hypothetical protein LTS12_014244 [Elasticomyces elasticus]
MEMDHDLNAYAPSNEQPPWNGQLSGNEDVPRDDDMPADEDVPADEDMPTDDDMLAEDEPESPQSLRMTAKWTSEMRAVAYLVCTLIKRDVELRADVFNEIYAEHLADCGLPEGLEYKTIAVQYRMTATRFEHQCADVDTILNSAKGAELRKRVMEVASAMGYKGDFVAQPRRLQVVWTADMRATAYIVCTTIADADPFALRTAIFNKVCGSSITKGGGLAEVGWQAIKQQYCTRTTDARQKALWAEANAILVDERGVDLRQRVTDVADEMGYISSGRPMRALTRSLTLKWTDEMKAAVHMIDNEIEDSPPFDLHTRIFNTMFGAQLSALGFPDGIVYSTIYQQLWRRGKATAPNQGWENAMAVADSDRGAELLQMARAISGLDRPMDVVRTDSTDAPAGYVAVGEAASAAGAGGATTGYTSGESKPHRERRRVKAPRAKWTNEMRATAYLISREIEDSPPYTHRTAIFNEMYADHLADLGFQAGIGYPMIHGQLSTRNEKGRGKQWPAAMAIADSTRGVELLEKVRELAHRDTLGGIVRAGPDNGPEGNTPFDTATSVANLGDVIYPDEEDPLEATAALRAALDLPSGTTPSYANLEDVLGMDDDNMAESVDSWLASVRAGGRR